MRVFVGVCLLGLLLVFSGLPAAQAASAPAEKKEPAKEAPSKFEALKRFSQVLNLVERYYVREVTQNDLINGAVKGLLQGLDPHSTFMNAEEYK